MQRITTGLPGEAPYYIDGTPTRLEPRPLAEGQGQEFYYRGRLVVQYTTTSDGHYVEVAKPFRRYAGPPSERFDRSTQNDQVVAAWTVRVGEYIVSKLEQAAKRGRDAAQLLEEV